MACCVLLLTRYMHVDLRLKATAVHPTIVLRKIFEQGRAAAARLMQVSQHPTVEINS
jgi:hypothetical protein